MKDIKDNSKYTHYNFHHIEILKCKDCKDFLCEKVCFRGIYKVINKDSIPECLILSGREAFCVKCHLCTTVCKKKAILID